MSVPPDAAHEPPESSGSPEEHLVRLLGRALNSFELPDETIRRLDRALAHDSSLHSAHHSRGLHRETYRHTWLLADGSALTLWELVHNTSPGGRGRLLHEVYTGEEDLRTATARLPLPTVTPDFELPVLIQLPPMPRPRHSYMPDDSADHARRLLRRAENTDVPGADMAQLLREACAHQITQAFGRPLPSGEGAATFAFSLYEHAFLLGDGREVSLWEVEHTATPDGRHMCEVYVSEAAAREAMERRASRAPGA
ncbi:DUF6227 family protein [Streptomyces uncialis]|uniref:DUF6227 family protein n=1 Tax=Streptomyces uncialis TaxID=1048205 RepID=UPI003790AA80